MRRQVDGRKAARGFGVAAVSMLVVLGFAAEPGLIGARRGPSAARELVGLMKAGEHGSWSVTYEFTRTLAGGRALRQSMQEARDPALHVLRSGAVMSVEQGSRSYNCNLADKRVACTESAAAADLPPSEVLRVAVSAGAYAVTEVAGDTIAGEQARCFQVVTTGRGELPDIGAEADFCLAASGVSLRQRIVSASGDVDERRAQSVTEPAGTSVVKAVARGFDPSAISGRG